MNRGKIEVLSHLLFWVFILFSINVDWTVNWFDPALRPNTPAPLSVIAFAAFFYINTFVLIPRYFSLESWKQYVFYGFLLFIAPELIRIALYQYALYDISFERALFSRDSFLFGTPSPFFIALNLSFVYRFTLNRFWGRKKVQGPQEGNLADKATVPYEHTTLLADEEADQLEQAILYQLESEEVYLNPELTLRGLAETVGSTEKKVSYLINQHLKTSYYELINKYRVEKFKSAVAGTGHKNLSIVGIALNCGFSSKSSFYRAFKSQVGMSPAAYIKHIVDKE